MRPCRLLIVVILTMSSCFSWAEKDESSAIEQQKKAQKQFRQEAEELVAKMTMEEKAAVYDMQSPEIKRLGIPAHDWWNEALHGVARNGKATQFPQSIAMASTWDPDLILKMATAIGDEARAIHHSEPGRNKRYQGLTIWSPTVNLARDPRWGRSEETYGEDPYLTSRMAIAFVKGLQGDHPKYYKTIATVKHFIANNTEHNRYDSAPPISERDMREYYLVPYQAAVEEANVQSLMTAYNGVNGIPATVNKRLLTDVLRGEWGFSGSVVTDAQAPIYVQRKHKYTKSHAETVALMIKAGVNVSSQKAPAKWTEDNCIQAVKQGLVTEAELDQVVIQNLTTRMQLGQIVDDADNPYKKIPMSVVGAKEHLAIAREIAQKGIVLLQNNPNGTSPLLPLDREKVKKIIVAGPYARSIELGGYSGTPTHTPTTPFEGIQRQAGDIDVELVTWGRAKSDSVVIPSVNLRVSMELDAQQGLKAEYFAGKNPTGKPATVRVENKIDFNWPKPLSNVDPDIPQPEFSARWTGALVPDVTGEYVLQTRGDDGMRAWLDGKQIINDWRNGSVRTKSSKPIRLTAGERYALRVEYYDSGAQAEAHLQWVAPKQTGDAGNLAGDADSTLVVYLAGFDLQMANEGKDLNDLTLPDDQKQDLESFLESYGNVVVVMFGGNIITEPWVFENVPAVLHAWYVGQEGGDALADLLFGKVSPSGKLPQTWFRTTDDVPHIDDYAVHTGRTYQYFNKPVQFPFGHGLSYTTFEYGEIAVSKKEVRSDDVLTVRVPVENSGATAAEEVVQVYVRNVESPVYQPKQKLVAFGRVSVAPGQTETLALEIPVERFAHWDVAGKRFVVEPGEFELRVGASSSDIRQKETVTVNK